MTPPQGSEFRSPNFVGCASQPFSHVPELDELSPSIGATSTTSTTKTKNITTTHNGNGNKTSTSSLVSWQTVASKKSLRTINPIRAIVDPIVANGIKSGRERGDGKDHISLALGDPTVGSSLPTCTVAVDALMRTLQLSCISNDTTTKTTTTTTTATVTSVAAAGYVNACGTPEARAAIAQYHKAESPNHVIVANGCSGALELVLTALLDEDSILLVPKPGFPLYQVICESHGANVVHYNLDSDHGWECDLHHMEEMIVSHSDQVRGLVINNPSNPTGSVYSEEHLRAILDLAERYQLVVVADEVYGDLTFGENRFVSMGQIMVETGRSVPVIVASGLGKQFLLPGWRVGWAVFYDTYNNALLPILDGAKRLAQVILGASHLAQSVIPALLVPSSSHDKEALSLWKSNLRQTLESQAMLLCDALSKCHGLRVLLPQGAMYALVIIHVDQFQPEIQSDLDFTTLLLQEENVFLLPGKAFGALESVFRVVYCASPQVLMEASDRIFHFCDRHAFRV